jgi:hypothetical protein
MLATPRYRLPRRHEGREEDTEKILRLDVSGIVATSSCSSRWRGRRGRAILAAGKAQDLVTWLATLTPRRHFGATTTNYGGSR